MIPRGSTSLVLSAMTTFSHTRRTTGLAPIYVGVPGVRVKLSPIHIYRLSSPRKQEFNDAASPGNRDGSRATGGAAGQNRLADGARAQGAVALDLDDPQRQPPSPES